MLWRQQRRHNPASLVMMIISNGDPDRPLPRIDPNQYSLDFELAAALAGQFESKNHEEGQNDKRPTLTPVPGGRRSFIER